LILEQNISTLSHHLKARIAGGLPGRDAHQTMHPVPLETGFTIPDIASDKGYPSGVLIPLYPGPGGTGDTDFTLHVLLTLRSAHIPHGGQISFPGGRCEMGETVLQTALRETEEEIGIGSAHFDIVGPLSPYYLYKTNNRITPFVGLMRELPDIQINPNEVEEVFSVPLHRLMTGDALRHHTRQFGGKSFRVPYWDVHDVPLWGATAMILSELLALFEEIRCSKPDTTKPEVA
jgi:mutator protein MutT